MYMKRCLLLLLTLVAIATGNLYGQTGLYFSQTYKADTLIAAFMKKWNIDGGAVAIARKGRVIYNRGFGYADQDSGEVAHPYHLYRIASVSKPITSIGVMKLIENNKLSLTDTVFGAGRIIDDNYYLGVITDSRIYDITVQQLLEHTAGWDRSVSCDGFSGCDPIGFPLHVTSTLGEGNPVTDSALIKFLLKKGLNDAPGTHYAYSNIGYLILAKVIERKTGKSYEEYMRTEIFEPLGLCDIKLAKNFVTGKHEREGEYNADGTTYSCYDSSQVPWQYGGLNVEAMHAHGGWTATAIDLVRLFLAVDSFNTVPDILQPSSIITMTTPSTVKSTYAKGWSVNVYSNWWHTGSLPGTATFIARSRTGYVWAFLFNNRSSSSGAFWSEFDDLPWDCISGLSAPSIDMMPPQTATTITSVTRGIGDAKIDWTAGSGDGRILVVHEDSMLTSFPIDSMVYTADAEYGKGDSIGKGAFVVYDGTANTVTISGLTPGKNYWVTAFEYYDNINTILRRIYKIGCRNTLAAKHKLSVQGIVNESSINIIPNPATDRIRIEGLNGAQGTCTIYGTAGKVVLKTDIEGDTEINISQLPAGVYTVYLNNNDVALHRKLIKL